MTGLVSRHESEFFGRSSDELLEDLKECELSVNHHGKIDHDACYGVTPLESSTVEIPADHHCGRPNLQGLIYVNSVHLFKPRREY